MSEEEKGTAAEVKRVRERIHQHADTIMGQQAQIEKTMQRMDGHEILCTERWRTQQQQRSEDKQAHENWKAEMRESMGRIRDKIEAGEKLQDTRHDANLKAIADVERRALAQERKQKNALIGALGSAVAALLTAVGTLAWHMISKGGP